MMQQESFSTLQNTCSAAFNMNSPPLSPKIVAETITGKNAASWAKAWNAELQRHDTESKTWTYEDPIPTDRPLSYSLSFKSKTYIHSRLERLNVRLAIRGEKNEARSRLR